MKQLTLYPDRRNDLDNMEFIPDSLLLSTASDVEGKFRLTGVGEDRVVLALIRHPQYGVEEAMILSTRNLPADPTTYRAGWVVFPLTNSACDFSDSRRPGRGHRDRCDFAKAPCWN